MAARAQTGELPETKNGVSQLIETSSQLVTACSAIGGASEPPPARLTRDVFALLERLPEWTATLQRHTTAATHAARKTLFLSLGDCLQMLVGSVIALLSAATPVELSTEAQWLQFMSAAVLHLEVVPAHLDECTSRIIGHAGAGMQGQTSLLSVLDTKLRFTVAAVAFFTTLDMGSAGLAPPPRVLGVLRAARLRPAKLALWAEAVARATEARLQMPGAPRRPDERLLVLLSRLMASGSTQEMREAVEARPGLQVAVAALVARWLSPPAEERAAAAADGSRCLVLAQAAHLATQPCLDSGRWAHERGACQAQQDGGASLLAAAGAWAAQPELVAGSGGTGQAALLMGCLAMQALLADDLARAAAFAADEVSQVHVRRLVQQLGSAGGLPLLSQLAAEVADAAPAAAAAAAASSSRGRGSGSGGFGPQRWHKGAAGWAPLLHAWSQSCAVLIQTPILSSAGVGAPACRAAEALLRLCALAPQQPAEEVEGGGGASWRSAGEAAAAFLDASHDTPGAAMSQELSLFFGFPAAASGLAGCLLAQSTAAEPSGDFGTAAIRALATACRYVHILMDALHVMVGGGGSGAPAHGGLGVVVTSQTAPAALRCLTAAAAVAVGVGDAALPRLEQEQQRRATRRLECCVFLYLSALAAVPGGVGTPDVRARVCHTLLGLLETASLEPTWRQLLSGASGVAAAVGFDPPRLLASVSVEALKACHPSAPGQGPRSPIMDVVGFEQALCVLLRAAQLAGPGVAADLAQEGVLVSELASAAAVLPGAVPAPPPGDDGGVPLPFSALQRVLALLAPHWPQPPGQQQPAWQHLGERCPTAQEVTDLAGWLSCVAGSLQQADASEEAPPQRQRPGPEALQLAVRRARALALRSSCANPRCTAMEGPSEAGSRGKLCTGCRTVRLCSDVCRHVEWPVHKYACRQLSAAAAAAQAK